MRKYVGLLLFALFALTTPALAAQKPMCYYGAVQAYLLCVTPDMSQGGQTGGVPDSSNEANGASANAGTSGIVGNGQGGTATATDTGPGSASATQSGVGTATATNTGPGSATANSRGTGTATATQSSPGPGSS